MVPDIGMKRMYDGRHGYIILNPALSGSISRVKSMRDKSLPICAANIYNSIPNYIRNYEGDECKLFKSLLDEFLSSLPDQPLVTGLVTNNMDGNSKPSNSIPDWIRNLSGTDISFHEEEVGCDF